MKSVVKASVFVFLLITCTGSLLSCNRHAPELSPYEAEHGSDIEYRLLTYEVEPGETRAQNVVAIHNPAELQGLFDSDTVSAEEDVKITFLSNCGEAYFHEKVLLFVSFAYSSSDKDIAICSLKAGEDGLLSAVVFDVSTPAATAGDIRWMPFFIEIAPALLPAGGALPVVRVHNLLRPGYGSAYHAPYGKDAPTMGPVSVYENGTWLYDDEAAFLYGMAGYEVTRLDIVCANTDAVGSFKESRLRGGEVHYSTTSPQITIYFDNPESYLKSRNYIMRYVKKEASLCKISIDVENTTYPPTQN